ncbi:MAG: hypothetical protein JNL72_03065 [Flavipsychrobacter sp.]|nr:hypothetical protein [Flavipsychrobacter sp.]
MRKTLFVFAAALIALSSCKKRNCWRCTTQVTAKNTNWLPPSGAAARNTYCDMTEAEIRQVEKDGTGTHTVVQEGKTYVSTTRTTCK